MEKMLNKAVSLAVIFATLFTLLVPMLASASNYALGEGIGDSNASKNELYQYNVNPNEVTLYVGDISINHGIKHERYLYTDKEVNQQTLSKIRDILTIDYKNLLPNKPGQILVNNFGADMSSGNWKSAYNIALERHGGAKVEKIESPNQSVYYKATINKLRRENKQECLQEQQDRLEISNEKEEQKVIFDHFVFNGNINLNDKNSFMVDTLKESESKAWFLNSCIKTLNEKLNYKNISHSVKVFDIDRTVVRVVSTFANVKLPKEISQINISIYPPLVGKEINLTVNDNNENFDKSPIVEINTKGVRKSCKPAWLKEGRLINLLNIDDRSVRVGNFEDNKEYEALVWINVDAPYDVADKVNVLINGQPPTECIIMDDGILLVVAKVKSEK